MKGHNTINFKSKIPQHSQQGDFVKMNATFQPCIVNFILQADSRYLINFVFSFGTCSKLLRHSKKVVCNKKIAKVGRGSDPPFVCNNKNH